MGNDFKVIIRPSVDAMAETAARAAREALADALAARGHATLVATGGTTPGPLYDRLSGAPLAWDKVTVTLSDERWAPPKSPDSNERLVRERLLTGPAAAASFVPLKGLGSPEEDAVQASAALAGLARPFDLVLLGMGEDGHIASLFPGSPALARALDPEEPALCLAVPQGEGRPPAQPRLTLSLAALRSARRLILLFSGRRKFDVLERALQTPDPLRYPVSAILTAPTDIKVICAS